MKRKSRRECLYIHSFSTKYYYIHFTLCPEEYRIRLYYTAVVLCAAGAVSTVVWFGFFRVIVLQQKKQNKKILDQSGSTAAAVLFFLPFFGRTVTVCELENIFVGWWLVREK